MGGASRIISTFTTESGPAILEGKEYMNLCAKLMEEPGYQHHKLATKVKDFLLDENYSQIVDDYTRIRSVNGNIQRYLHPESSVLGKVITLA